MRRFELVAMWRVMVPALWGMLVGAGVAGVLVLVSVLLGFVRLVGIQLGADDFLWALPGTVFFALYGGMLGAWHHLSTSPRKRKSGRWLWACAPIIVMVLGVLLLWIVATHGCC